MKQLLRGAAKFNQSSGPEARALFERLATEGQRPEALLITCVDSRVMPSVITDAPAGSLLTLRNVGNFVPDPQDCWVGGDSSVAATIEFALNTLGIQDIIIMGHSECGGIAELHARRNDFSTDPLGTWLRNGKHALDKLSTDELTNSGLSLHDRLSQLNVLTSRAALARYPAVRDRLDRLQLTLHAWWFDIHKARVLGFEPRSGKFVPIEEAYESTLADAHGVR